MAYTASFYRRKMATRTAPLVLSVVIPAYNESERLGATLQSAARYLSAQPYESEMIVVDDGSGDDTTQLVRTYMDDIPDLKLLHFSQNQGKGWAVRAGMLNARGAYRLFMDADGSTDIAHWDTLRSMLDAGADVAVGSRHIAGSDIRVHQGAHRELLGAVFRNVVKTGFGLSIIDTQNGFKAFTAQAAERIFRRQKVRGWAFDVEILSIAQKLGYSAVEVPVVWIDDNRSRMTISAMPRMLAELFRIRMGVPEPQPNRAAEIPQWV
jgi:dolichyl-phosphate beta-glucosyltransferase